MEVKRAKTAGFCFGVKRAVDMVYQHVKENKDTPIYTYGPIIHNQEVINDMKQKGVEIIRDEADLDKIQSGIVIIRSHGVPRRTQELLEKKGLTCVDATCPFVKKIHRIVEEESKAGKRIVIIGDANHSEVQGIKGWSESDVTVIRTEEEAEAFEAPVNTEVCVVSQTTFNYNKFKYLVEILSKKNYNISVLNTICSATKERQTEAEGIAKEVDMMIVIGDKQSSNTQKLFEICRNACDNTCYIQTLKDLDMNLLKSVQTVGITAGASTPNNIIEEVQNNVRINF